MTNRPQIRKQDHDPFEAADLLDRQHAVEQRPSPAVRVIGASCGAFVFCFVAILLTVVQMEQIGQQTARLLWISALVCGAVGGFAFPRVSHFLSYGFLIFVNVMLSLTIGRNLREQALLFGIFAFVELIFFMSRCVVKTNRHAL